jgi:copper chaperone CopZ
MKKNIYKITGIDCASCAQKIEDKLYKMDGIYNATLSFVIQKLFVTYDETMINDEEIEECIHKSLSGIRIIEKNNQKFIDTYEEPTKTFKKIIFPINRRPFGKK